MITRTWGLTKFAAGLVVVLLPIAGLAQTQTDCVTLYLAANKSTYLPTEPIQLEVGLVNDCGAPVAVAPTDVGERLGQLLTFIHQGQRVIRFSSPVGGMEGEPGPPLRYEDPETGVVCDATEVEVLAAISPGNQRIARLDNAKTGYDLSALGPYQVYASVGLGRYEPYRQDPLTDKMLACLQDLVWIGNPLQSNPVAFFIEPAEPMASLPIEVAVQTNGATPLPGVSVALFKSSAIPEQCQPVDNPANYHCVWENVIPPLASALTAYDGKVSFARKERDNYTVIGMFTGDKTSNNPIFSGSLISSEDPGWNADQPIRPIMAVQVSEDAINEPPVANAGPDQTVFVDSLVALDGSASQDPDNGPSSLTFSWTMLGGPTTVALAGADTAYPSFTPTAVGDYQFRLQVSDGKDSASDDVKVSAKYNFTGFFPPVDNPPTFNVMKAGAAVPVKFSLNGNKGLDILSPSSPSSVKVNCDTTSPTDTVQQTVTAGASSLQYDAAANQYVYVWKTDRAWANTCRQFVINFKDGVTIQRANFKFTR